MGTQSSLPPQGGFFSLGTKTQNGWKVDGWVRWLEGLRGNYERRMNVMCELLEENKYILKTGRRRKQISHHTELQSTVDPSDDAEEWRHIIKQQVYLNADLSYSPWYRTRLILQQRLHANPQTPSCV